MTAQHTAQGNLFATAGLPDGLVFEPELIDLGEEQALLALISQLPLQAARFHQYTARRRVFAYGSRFDYDSGRTHLARVGELPPPLDALRERLAGWAGIAASEFAHVMIAEYPPGAPLGWHRDAPGYETIVGVSLGSPAQLRLRRWPPRAERNAATLSLELAPRSAYLMRGSARWGWQHSVPPVAALRHSVTMRTPRHPPPES